MGFETVKVVEKVPLVAVDSLGGLIQVGSARLDAPARIGAAIASHRERVRELREKFFGFMGAVGGRRLKRVEKGFLSVIVREPLQGG
jgi:hypothetical protein